MTFPLQRELPTRFHIGTQRAGSSYFFNLLKEHPDIILTPEQEVSFYTQTYEDGLDRYLQYFPDEEGVKIDTSPKYFMQGKTAAPRIQETVREFTPKFLLILRNPIDYVRSHYQFHRRTGYFDSHPEKYPDLPDGLISFLKRYPGYLERGYYSKILRRHWFSHFSRNQFKIVIFEEFIDDTQRITKEILRFFQLPPKTLKTRFKSRNATLRHPILYDLRNLLVRFPQLKQRITENPLFNLVYKHVLTSKSDTKLSEEARTWLSKQFEDDVRELKRIMKTRLSQWQDFGDIV